MINVQFEGRRLPLHDTFIDECIMALFPEDANYDIFIEVKKYIDEAGELGTHAGLCVGDNIESVISIATHWIYEDGEEVEYEPHELAATIAHELVHAKQFYKGQINMNDNVWKRNTVVIDCEHIDYKDLPWEVEAYAYEELLTDILWENV